MSKKCKECDKVYTKEEVNSKISKDYCDNLISDGQIYVDTGNSNYRDFQYEKCWGKLINE